MAADDPITLTSIIVDSLNRVEGKLDAGLARVEAKMESKADKSDLAEIRGELKGHANDIAALKEVNRVRDAENKAVNNTENAREARRTRRTTIVLSFLGTAALLISVVEAFVLH